MKRLHPFWVFVLFWLVTGGVVALVPLATRHGYGRWVLYALIAAVAVGAVGILLDLGRLFADMWKSFSRERHGRDIQRAKGPDDRMKVRALAALGAAEGEVQEATEALRKHEQAHAEAACMAEILRREVWNVPGLSDKALALVLSICDACAREQRECEAVFSARAELLSRQDALERARREHGWAEGTLRAAIDPAAVTRRDEG